MQKVEVFSLKSTRSTGYVKRIFDVIFSLSALLLISPLLILIAIGIKISSKGCVFFSQDRLKHGGQTFTCWKFRTMHENAEEILVELLEQNSDLKEEWQNKQKLKEDPRIFTLGKLLRKTSLDELPQFWNVLLGDMSVVGPRPYMVSQKDILGQHSEKILSMRPGVTGLWQTSGRSQTTFQTRIELDMRYVEEASFWYDLKLIFKTLPCMLFSQDAC